MPFPDFWKRGRKNHHHREIRQGVDLRVIAVVILVLAVSIATVSLHDSFSLTRPGMWFSGPAESSLDPAAAELATDSPADRTLDGPDPAASAGPVNPREYSASNNGDNQHTSQEVVPAAPQPESLAGRQAPIEKDEDEPEPELTIAGAVLDEQGSLLPGVLVEARPVGEPGQSRRRTPSTGHTLSQTTDSLGTFNFNPLAEGEYELTVNDSDAYHGTRMRVRAGVVNAELHVQRIRSIRVHGQIVDENGMPLADVRVRSLGGTHAPSSDEGGSYEITVEPVRTGQPPVLEFQRSNYRSQRQRISAAMVPTSDEVRLDVEMQPDDERVAVLGYVFGPRGESVEGAEVWLSSANPREYLRTRTNEGGAYQFQQVETGNAWRLGVNPGKDYRKYVSETFVVAPPHTTQDVQLEASGTGSLSGRLIDPDGRALGRFTLWLRSVDAGSHGPIPVVSDAGGNFEVEEVPAGRLRLETTSQPRLQAGGIELAPGEMRYLEVPMDWGDDWLFGQVVDPQGNPVPGTRVTLQWQQQNLDLTSSSHRQSGTDLEGHFNFSNLGARDYQVTVQAPGFQTVRRSLSPGLDEARIVIEAQSIAGGGQ